MDNIYQNPLVMKIHNGTQRSDANLCLTCRNAPHIQAARSNAGQIRCQASTPFRVLEPVARCTGYYDRTKPTLMDMQEIAWQLHTDKGGRSIGFMSPEDLRRRNEGELPPSNPGFGA